MQCKRVWDLNEQNLKLGFRRLPFPLLLLLLISLHAPGNEFQNITSIRFLSNEKGQDDHMNSKKVAPQSAPLKMRTNFQVPHNQNNFLTI